MITNGDIIDAVIKEGPLPLHEVRRRAKIVLYNHLTVMYNREIAELQTVPTLHPETRQVMGMTAELVDELATKILDVEFPIGKSDKEQDSE